MAYKRILSLVHPTHLSVYIYLKLNDVGSHDVAQIFVTTAPALDNRQKYFGSARDITKVFYRILCWPPVVHSYIGCIYFDDITWVFVGHLPITCRSCPHHALLQHTPTPIGPYLSPTLFIHRPLPAIRGWHLAPLTVNRVAVQYIRTRHLGNEFIFFSLRAQIVSRKRRGDSRDPPCNAVVVLLLSSRSLRSSHTSITATGS